MKVLVVDDEVLARERMKSLLAEIGSPWEVVGEAADGAAAITACASGTVDLVLMDIRMPGVDGLAAAASLAALEKPPALIFVTAFDQHALAAFEANAVDYLLKPVRRDRLQLALERARRLTRAQLVALGALQEPEGYLTASYRGGLQRIPIVEVVFLRAEQKYVVARHHGGDALLDESLKAIEERFPGRFLRVHRNAMIAPDALRGLEKTADGRTLCRLEGSDEGLEVSRRHLAAVRRRLRSVEL